MSFDFQRIELEFSLGKIQLELEGYLTNYFTVLSTKSDNYGPVCSVPYCQWSMYSLDERYLPVPTKV